MNNKNLPTSGGIWLRLLRIGADILSSVFIGYAVYCGIWVHNHPGPGTPLPIQLKLFFADIIPLVLGFAWLLYRYYAPWVMKHPTILARTNDIRWRIGFGVTALIIGFLIKAL